MSDSEDPKKDSRTKRPHRLADHLYGEDYNHSHDGEGADHDHDHDRFEATGPLLLALATLPPSQQEVLRLRFGFHDTPMSLAEIADEVGKSVGTVQSLQRGALRALRELLE